MWEDLQDFGIDLDLFAIRIGDVRDFGKGGCELRFGDEPRSSMSSPRWISFPC